MRRTVKVQRKVLMQRYALEELKLIAVVTGRTKPLAMFRDPTGLGISVMRGDYLSKSAGRVKQILPDRVIVQIEEYTEDQQRVAERVVYLGR
jgi:Tfp pilus assembly protein PilP